MKAFFTLLIFLGFNLSAYSGIEIKLHSVSYDPYIHTLVVDIFNSEIEKETISRFSFESHGGYTYICGDFFWHVGHEEEKNIVNRIKEKLNKLKMIYIGSFSFEDAHCY